MFGQPGMPMMGGAPMQGMGMPPMGMGMPGMGMPPMGGAPMGMPMGGQPFMGHQMGPPMGAPSYAPPAGQAVATSPAVSAAPIQQFQQPMGQHMMGQPMMGQPFGMGQPMMGQPQYGQPMMGGQPMVQRFGQQPPQQQQQYGQPQVQYRQAQPVQHQPVQQAQPTEETITVNIIGRDGVNDVINGTYTSCGEHGGRYCFYAPTNEGPIYLYYDQGADNWCIGDQIGSQSYYAVCGPSGGEDMAQEWRIWTGDTWENDAKIAAQIK